MKIPSLAAAFLVYSTAHAQDTNQVAAWAQCAGNDYVGSSECVEGYECQETDVGYSQCVEVAQVSRGSLRGYSASSSDNNSVEGVQHVAAWAQCAGTDYVESSECVEGYECQETDVGFSQCIKVDTVVASNEYTDSTADGDFTEGFQINSAEGTESASADGVQLAAAWAQCAGTDFTGPSACVEGYECQETDVGYSQCVQVQTSDVINVSKSEDSNPDENSVSELADGASTEGFQINSDAGVSTEGFQINSAEGTESASVDGVQLAAAWAQCAGTDFNGPSTCVEGYECQETDVGYSQCVEVGATTDSTESANAVEGVQLAGAWERCGGDDFVGPASCVEGYVCKEIDVGSSHCVQE
ncbi:hypothetical protein AC1031_005546 [Aphanomyces cochlioides]|nr:hypothetical protein AC1031_005546 [Aphanomyces cochlioides]